MAEIIGEKLVRQSPEFLGENLPGHLQIYHRIESIFRSSIQRKLKIPRRKDFLSCSYLQIEEFGHQQKVEGNMR